MKTNTKRTNFAIQSTFNMKLFKLIFAGCILCTLLSSCGINSNIMLKTPRDYKFDSIPMSPTTEYHLAPNDIVSFRLYANDGFKLIDLSAGTLFNQNGGGVAANRVAAGGAFIQYLIRPDSLTRLPMLGEVKLAGLTKLEAEKKLEEEYSKYYVNPYVQVQITNKRVIVFPGDGASAQVVNLVNNNTTLLEALATVGGIPDRGRAKRIKIIRQVGSEKQIYQVDMSTIDPGINYVNMILQANDIIYVEPVPELSRGLLREISPIVSLVSSVFVIYLTVNNLR